MPLLIGLLIVFGAMYQFFFRYEQWPSRQKEGVFYEHDNLTGETRQVAAGAKTSVFARILGQGEGEHVQWDRVSGDIDQNVRQTGDRFFDRIDPDEVSAKPVRFTEEPESSLKNPAVLSKIARPVPVPKEVVVASNAPPVPMAMMAVDMDENEDASKPFAVRQVDLDQDGAAEEIIQNAVHSDGLLDISIVRGGREIFFGRGIQISLLPTQSREGWSDIALKPGGKSGMKVFRYDRKQDAYKQLQ